MMSSAHTNTLWMGDLEPYMDEVFVNQAFFRMGCAANSVKIIRNKLRGIPLGYCFVEFSSPELAHRTMLRLNGKIVPGSEPPRRFKLNAGGGKEHLSNEFSLFVGELTTNVDDFILFNAFEKRYKSTKAAKVVLGPDGISKGFGFVRFGDTSDQRKALVEMQHMTGISRKPITVSLATPRRNNTGGDQHWYNNYQHQHPNQPQNYYGNYAGYPGQYNQYPNPYTGLSGDQQQGYPSQEPLTDEETEELEDPEVDVDIEKENLKFMARSEEFYEALEESRWYPLDTIYSTIQTEISPVVASS